MAIAGHLAAQQGPQDAIGVSRRLDLL